MSSEYYDSELTAEQIEQALNAIHGVIVPANNGKVLAVENGLIVAKNVSEWGQGGYPEPTGTIPITENGTVNVKDYASAEVNVPSGITAADEGKVVKNGVLVAQTARATEITANGTYNTTENNSITVNVSGGSGIVLPYFWVGYMSYKDGCFGALENKVGGIVPRNANLQNIRPDWSQPFKIHIRFYAESNRSRVQCLFGCRSSEKYYVGGPTAELRTDGNFWCAISTNGSSWNKTITFPAGTILPETWYDATFEFDGTDYIVTITDGSTTVTDTIEEIGTPYFNSLYYWQLGNIAQRNDLYANMVWFDISSSYLESNGSKIWGAGIS